MLEIDLALIVAPDADGARVFSSDGAVTGQWLRDILPMSVNGRVIGALDTECGVSLTEFAAREQISGLEPTFPCKETPLCLMELGHPGECDAEVPF